MKKRIFLLLLLITSASSVGAQPVIEKSDPVVIPEKVDFVKILLLKNGNTIYLHYSGSDGLIVDIYNNRHQLATTNKITSDKWDAADVDNTQILGTYEINREIVVFLQQPEKRHPILYRLRINEDDGKVIEEEILAQTRRDNRLSQQNRIFVVKDRNSGSYAVIYYDDMEDAGDNNIKVMHFNEKHALLSVAHLKTLDKKLKHIEYLDGLVLGEDAVYLATYFDDGGDISSKIVLSKLKHGETSLTSKTMDFTKSSVQLGFNTVTGNIQMVMNTLVKSKRATNFYTSVLCFIDPETITVKSAKELSSRMINAYAHNNLNKEEEFTGVPQEMIIRQDGSTTIIKETVSYYEYGGRIIAAILGDIGISELDIEGNDKRGYLLPYRTNGHGVYDALYLKTIHNGYWCNPSFERSLNYSLQDHAIRFIAGKTNCYLVTDTYCKDVTTTNLEKLKKIDAKRAHMNAYYASLRNGNISEQPLFGPLEGKKDKTMCFMDAADQSEDGTFSSIVTFQRGKSIEARLVWIKFE